MKKFLALVLALASILAFSACGNKDEVPDGFQLASDADACAYSLYIPENWVAGNGGSSMTTATANGSGEKCNISFALLAEYPQADAEGNVTIAAIWNADQEKFKAIFGESFTVLEQCNENGEPNAWVGDKQAYRYVYTATYLGTEYKFMQVYVSTVQGVYVFTYTATTATDKDGVAHYDKHLEQVNAILGYVTFD